MDKKEIRDNAWSYFELHANQRMSIFNFYVTISTAIFTGIAAFLSIGIMSKLIIYALSIILILISIVFWYLDSRTKFLIRISESVMKNIEIETGINEELLLFSREESETKKIGFPQMLSYSKSFRIIYCLFIFLGIMLIICGHDK